MEKNNIIEVENNDDKKLSVLQYPVLFVHGHGFRDYKRISYWGRIPTVFSDKGCKIFYGQQEGGAVIEENAQSLKKRIEDILKETNAEKVNVIAHSKGGLDMRYMISSLDMADKVSSLTTIATPHHGSLTIEKVPERALKFAAFFANYWMKVQGDKNPNAYKSYLSFKNSEAIKFNEENPNSEKVYYQSYAFGMAGDFLLSFSKHIIEIWEGENDGLVSARSAEWGEFKGIKRSNSRRGISHCDAVDLRRRRLTKKKGKDVSDILEVYEEIYQTLFSKGF